MIFIAAANEPTMFLILTEQDVNDMRGGRTKYVDRTATQGHRFDKVVLSVHRDQHEIEDMVRRAGHGKLLEGMPSPKPEPPMGVCRGCKGIVAEPLLLEGQCIACWCESSKTYRALYLAGDPGCAKGT